MPYQIVTLVGDLGKWKGMDIKGRPGGRQMSFSFHGEDIILLFN